MHNFYIISINDIILQREMNELFFIKVRNLRSFACSYRSRDAKANNYDLWPQCIITVTELCDGPSGLLFDEKDVKLLQIMTNHFRFLTVGLSKRLSSLFALWNSLIASRSFHLSSQGIFSGFMI